MIRFADDIRIWRLTYRLRQQDAAELANVSLTTWSRWERDVTYPGEDDYNSVRWLIAQPPPGYVRPDQSAEGIALLHDELADQVGR
jgi:hypothetical protein